LRVTLTEAIAMNREDARRAAGHNFEETPISVWNAAICCGICSSTDAPYFGKVAVTLGGITLHWIGVALSLVTTKSMITWPARYARILACRNS